MARRGYPALTYQIGGGGLVNGDALSGALTPRRRPLVAGAYPILVGTLAASANYALTFTPSQLTITEPPRPTQTSTRSRKR